MIVYPNPTTGIVQLELSNNLRSGLDVVVFNEHGHVIKQQENRKGNCIELDLRNCAAGDYFIRVYADDKVITRKIKLEA